MLSLTKLTVALAAAAGVLQHAVAQPIKVNPAANDIDVTRENTVNGTAVELFGVKSAEGNPLEFSITNNVDDEVNAYVTGTDPSGAAVMLLADGGWFYPDDPNSEEPVEIQGDTTIKLNPKGEETTFRLPDFADSVRVWFAVGELKFFVLTTPDGIAIVQPSHANPEDPSSAVNWGFIELTWTKDGGIWANISFVDFVGLPLGMSLKEKDGNVQETLGVQGDAIRTICDELRDQADKDGLPWDDLCQTSGDTFIRVVSPYGYVADGNKGFDDYYTEYIDKVYEEYQGDNILTVNTQIDAGEVACTSDGEELTCEGDDAPFPKPTAADIFGCNSGPFANEGTELHKNIGARLCAAFHRGTFLIKGGNVQPGPSADTYYQTEPANFYSASVHKHEVDGKGYAFPYDDVNPEEENASGTVASAQPDVLTIIVGGPQD